MYQYFHEGNFEKYIKKARKIYREKYEPAVQSAKEHIPCESITGEGGLHIFIKRRDGIDARKVLAECYKKGVIFMPGDVFYTDNTGVSTMRIGFSRVETEDIKKAFKSSERRLENMKQTALKAIDAYVSVREIS